MQLLFLKTMNGYQVQMGVSISNLLTFTKKISIKLIIMLKIAMYSYNSYKTRQGVVILVVTSVQNINFIVIVVVNCILHNNKYEQL